MARTVQDLELPSGKTLTAEDVSAIKNHLFIEEHPIVDYDSTSPTLRRYDADPATVDAWQRLIDGNPHHSDLV